MQVVFASSSPFGAEAVSLRGYVDEVSENGIEGWAVDLNDVSVPVQLDLLVEGTAICRCSTEYVRSDLTQFLGGAARPGFSFGPGALDALRRLFRVIPNARLWVRIVGADLALRSEPDLPALALIFGGMDRQPWEAGSRDLLAQLSRHRAGLRQRMLRPFQPSLKGRIGFIEAVMPDRAHTWLIGWMRRDEARDQPVVILDRQKFAAALAFFTFERDDLPASDCGFIGLLVGDWVPTPASQAHLFLGENQLAHLETVRPLPILSAQEFGERFDDHLPSATGLNVRLLQHVLWGAESWAVRPASMGFSATAAVDRLLVLPNFGVLVEGWVLCPSKHWKTLALRFGNTVLACDPATIRRKSRTDLPETARGDGLTESAGFTAALLGLLPISEIETPMLKIVYEDGTTSNHLVDPGTVVRLSPDAMLQTAVGLFPALAAESFFPAFARGLLDDLGLLTRTWSVQTLSPAERVIVVTVGRDRSDIFYLFAELTHFVATAPTDIGVVLLAEPGESRNLVTQLFAQFEADAPVAASLFLLENADYALHALPAILVAVGAVSFAFFGRPAVPTQAGWQAALAVLENATLAVPVTLGSRDPVAAGFDEMSVRCFVWDRWAFAEWLADRPVLLGGGLLKPTASGAEVPDAARLTAPVTTARIAASVNQTVEATWI